MTSPEQQAREKAHKILTLFSQRLPILCTKAIDPSHPETEHDIHCDDLVDGYLAGHAAALEDIAMEVRALPWDDNAIKSRREVIRICKSWRKGGGE